ncbi:MAG TPA: PTS sugar transporter subunit IIA [Polyangiales bacterium]|nr:PTS sugar transporter subunit IIA [Polyangiales bacterium]
MRLEEVLHADDVTTELPAADKQSTLRGLARLLSRRDDLDEDAVYQAIADRERLATTGIGSGVAMPHGRLRVNRPRMALAICRQGIAFDSVDGEPARILVALLTPYEHPGEQIKVLARVSRVLRRPSVRERLLHAASGDDALRIMVEEDQRYH